MEAVKELLREKKISWNKIDKILITGKSIKNSKDYKNFFFLILFLKISQIRSPFLQELYIYLILL